MKLTVSDICTAVRGSCPQSRQPAIITGISIDSRTAKAGDIFVPLAGEHADGHAFIGDAFARGAAASLVQKNSRVRHGVADAADRLLIEVDDTLDALGDIAAFWRRRCSAHIVAVTGSNGKTTTKEMAWSIIKNVMPCMKNPGNFNNLIGLPLSLCALEPDHRSAVLEIGMNRKGEIRRLAAISGPQTGVITNICPAHLEELPTLDDVAEAKAELFEHLSHNDTAVVNADDPRVCALGRKTAASIVTYGLGAADVSAANIEPKGFSGTAFELKTETARTPVFLPCPGKHFVSNALAAAAVARAMGIGPDDIKRGLESFSGVSGRMQILDRGGVRIINDAYNANPASMKAALDLLASTEAAGKKIAVLGDMLELGERSAHFHEELGLQAARLDVDRLFLVGAFAGHTKRGAEQAGMDSSRIVVCRSAPEAAAGVDKCAAANDVILLKGSRKMRMESCIDYIRGEQASLSNAQ